MTEKIGYKVLKITRNSLLASLKEGGRKYLKGRATKPKAGCGPLCIFSDRNSAKRLLQRQLIPNTTIIVKCNYTPSTQKRVWNFNRFKRSYNISSLPFNTVLASSVTCLE